MSRIVDITIVTNKTCYNHIIVVDITMQVMYDKGCLEFYRPIHLGGKS